MFGLERFTTVSGLVRGLNVVFGRVNKSIEKHDEALNRLLNMVFPVGAISEFGGDIAPKGFLICHGQAISRSEYPDLFKVIGTKFGNGDGNTTFNVPNFQGLVPRGAGTQDISGRTKDGGALGTVLEDQMQKIEGTINKGSSNGGLVGGQAGVDIQTTGAFSHTTIATSIAASGSGYRYLDFTFDSSDSPNARTSSTTDGETRVSSIGINYIIKY